MTKIVKITEKHLKDLVSIGKSHWFYEKWLSIRYLKNTLDKRGFHFTAIINGKLVGSIMVVEEDYPKYWIFYFAVGKNYRRKGIGTALLKKIESKLKNGNFLFVDIEKSDKTGINFYSKNKFKVMGKVKNWFEKDRTGIIMAKEI